MSSSKKGTDELSPFAIRDPFKVSPFFEIDEKDPDVVERAILRLLPEQQRKAGVILASRSSRPKWIIDAKVGGFCDLCGHAVWRAPSTPQGNYNIVCTDCLARGMA
jgi:hypothetical protein